MRYVKSLEFIITPVNNFIHCDAKLTAAIPTGKIVSSKKNTNPWEKLRTLALENQIISKST